MTTARDIMRVGAECIDEHETLAQAARRMRDLDMGRAADLRGVLTGPACHGDRAAGWSGGDGWRWPGRRDQGGSMTGVLADGDR